MKKIISIYIIKKNRLKLLEASLIRRMSSTLEYITRIICMYLISNNNSILVIISLHERIKIHYLDYNYIMSPKIIYVY